MRCPSTGPKRSLLVHPCQSHRSPRISYQLVAAARGTQQTKSSLNQKKVIIIFDLRVRPSRPRAFTQKVSSLLYISGRWWRVALKVAAQTSATLGLPKEFIEDDSDKANQWNKNHDKDRTLNQSQFKLEPACTWNDLESLASRQQLVIPTTVHTILISFVFVFNCGQTSQISSGADWSLTSPMARPSRARAWKSWFNSSMDRTCQQTKQ